MPSEMHSKYISNTPPLKYTKHLKIYEQAKGNNFTTYFGYNRKVGPDKEEIDFTQKTAEFIYNFFGKEDCIISFIVVNQYGQNRHSHQIAIQKETPVGLTEDDKKYGQYGDFSVTWIDDESALGGGVYIYKLVKNYANGGVDVIASTEAQDTLENRENDNRHFGLMAVWFNYLVRKIQAGEIVKTRTEGFSPIKIIFRDRVETYWIKE